MKPPSYDANYARKVLKHIDEVIEFNEMLITQDEILTEYIEVVCVECGAKHIAPQVIFNPFGYGTEGAVLLKQHHSCSGCGADSVPKEAVFQMLLRVQEYDVYDHLETVI